MRKVNGDPDGLPPEWTPKLPCSRSSMLNFFGRLKVSPVSSTFTDSEGTRFGYLLANDSNQKETTPHDVGKMIGSTVRACAFFCPGLQ